MRRYDAFLTVRALFFVVLSLLFIFFDHHSKRFRYFHDNLTIIALPVQKVVDTPFKLFHVIKNIAITQKKLLEENAKLRANELFLKARLQKVLALEKENAELHQLLNSKLYIGGKTDVAQLLSVHLDSSLQQLLLDKGSSDGVYVGQPVLDPYGVMGQIISVNPLTSKVLLLTDEKSAIPVENYRSNMRSIAIGTGRSDRLVLVNVVETTGIKVGDLFVSSGLGLRFPIGYPVGIVKKIAPHADGQFAKIILRPTAHLYTAQQVLLKWPEQVSFQKSVKKELHSEIDGKLKR